MTPAQSPRWTRVPGRLAGIVAAHSVVVLVGWSSSWQVFTRPSPRFIPMAPSTALAFLVLGLALLALRVWAARAGVRVAVAAGAWAVAGLAVLNLAFPARVDEMLGGGAGSFGPVQLGVMSPLTAGGRLLLVQGIGLLTRRALGASIRATLPAPKGSTVPPVHAYGSPLLFRGGTRPGAPPPPR